MIALVATITVDALLELLRPSLTNAAVAAAAMRMAPVKRPGAFFACMILCGLLAYATPSKAMETVWYIGGIIINYIVIPFLFWKESPAHKVLYSTLLPLWLLANEMLVALLLVSLGAPVTHGTIPDSLKWLLVAPQCAILILGGTLIGRFLQSARTANAPAVHCPPQYVLPLLLQLLATVGAVQVAVSANLEDSGVYVSLGLLCALLIVAGTATLFSMERYAVSAREHEREQALEQMLNESLAQSREAIAASEKTARLRHDQRNHLQVLRVLIEHGDLDEARSYAAALREELGDGQD